MLFLTRFGRKLMEFKRKISWICYLIFDNEQGKNVFLQLHYEDFS